MKEKTIYFTMLIVVILALFSLEARAEVVEVGKSPDPYQEVWATATTDDIEALRCVIFWESGECACPEATNLAIIETVLNRVIYDGEWKNTIAGVCKEKGQFYCKSAPHRCDELIYKQIEYVKQNGRTVLPDYDYCFFATKRQSIAKDHLWIGYRKSNGNPRKGYGMYFGRRK